MKADLIFYTEAFGGDCKIPAEKFPLWEIRAEAFLEKLTGGNESIYDDRVKMCICEMAECLYAEAVRDGIESEENDGYSVRYKNGDIKTKLMDIASLWLSGTDMLYRGVDNGR